MKKISCYTFVILIMLLIAKCKFCSQKEVRYINYDPCWELVKIYAKDSINIAALVGDTFALPSTPSKFIRDNKLFLEIENARQKTNIFMYNSQNEPIIDSTRYYFAVIDLQNKKLIDIIRFKEGKNYGITDFYRDTFYLSGLTDLYHIQYYDMKRKKYGLSIIDPCGNGISEGGMMRSGNLLFISGVYATSIVNWDTKQCIDSDMATGNRNSSGTNFFVPDNEDLTVLLHHSNDDIKYYRAYNRKGKTVWTFATKGDFGKINDKIYYALSKDTLSFVDKKNGKIRKNIILENGYQYFDRFGDIMRFKKFIRPENEESDGYNFGFNSIKGYDVNTGKELYTKIIKGGIDSKLDNYYFTRYAKIDKSKPKDDRPYQRSFYYCYAYDRETLTEIKEHDGKAVKKKDNPELNFNSVTKMRVFNYDIDNFIIKDVATNRHYALRGKYLYW